MTAFASVQSFFVVIVRLRTPAVCGCRTQCGRNSRSTAAFKRRRVPHVRTNAVRSRASTDGHHVIVLCVRNKHRPIFPEATGLRVAQGRKEGLDPTSGGWLR